MRTYMGQLFEAALNVLQTDNQENAVSAVKLILDLVKTYKGHMETQAQLFLDVTLQVGIVKESVSAQY